MTSERRLIQDAMPGDLRHQLLRAGREAAPAADAKERLLGALLPNVGAPVAAGALKASGMPAASSVLQASVLSKLALLSVLGAVATGTWYAIDSYGGSSRLGSAGTANPAEAPAVSAAGRGAQPEESASLPVPPAAGAALVAGVPARAQSDSPLPTLEQPSGRTHARAAAGTRPRPWSKAARRLPSRSARTPTPAAAEASFQPLTSPKLPQRLSVDDAQLREELRALDAVRIAVRAGQPSAARALLAEYFQRFPQGFSSPEARRLALDARERDSR